MFHTSYIEINKTALQNNLSFLKRITGPETRFCSVVKGNAYGHGIEHFLPLAEECGVDFFGVHSADEALRADMVKDKKSHLMIMGMIDDNELNWAVEKDISFYVFDFGRLDAAVDAAKNQKKKARIHLELETGMNRVGFAWEDRNVLAERVKENLEFLEVTGISTHFAGAESIANYLRVQNQIANYNRYQWFLRKNGVKATLNHTACSAPLISYPHTKMDMVRVGIAQYGYWPSKETHMQYLTSSQSKNMTDRPLRQIINWKTKIMSLKHVHTGEFIGYGTAYQATDETTIATVPVGYSHGFNRSLSNLGKVLIHGRRVPVIGMVNMNMIIVDVSHCPGVQRGDEVVLIGNQEGNRITVSSFSDLTRNVNYETLVRLPRDIPRFIIEESDSPDT
ncbi:alanine racemase [Balneolaceae bacterium ANBcel3]|nr:alanine racemase [Balneolaceae bacterium ANBcel3]